MCACVSSVLFCDFLYYAYKTVRWLSWSAQSLTVWYCYTDCTDPRTPAEHRFYKNHAIDFSRVQVGIDTFLFSGQYTDVATLSVLSKYTAGSTYFYPAFSASRDGKFSCCVDCSVATFSFGCSVAAARSNGLFAVQCCRSPACCVPCLLTMRVLSPSLCLTLLHRCFLTPTRQARSLSTSCTTC
jgi:hypothetical protein